MMAATLGFDELNKPEFDSEAYIKEYFKPMRISEERKEEREEAAHSFLDVLLFILTLISMENEFNALDWAYIEAQFQKELKNAALQYARESKALDDYISEKAEEFIRVTQSKFLSDPYWTSEERATMEAVNEANDVVGYEEWQKAIDEGYEYKIWRTERDTKVRRSHQAVEGKKLPIKDMFEVGNGLMRYPHDWYYNPDECYNCRCALDFADKTGTIVKTNGKVRFTSGANDAIMDYREFKVDTHNTERFVTYNNGVEEVITAKPILNSTNNVYVSDKYKGLKRKELSRIESWATQIKNVLSVDGAASPQIVIVDTTELLSGTGGRYNPVSNVLYIKHTDNYKRTRETLLHEFIHWKDAQEYILKGNIISDGNAFLEMLNKRHKITLDKLGIFEKEAGGISPYAEQRYKMGYYFETYTEYRTKKLIGRIR